MTNTTVSSGVINSGLTLNSGDTLNVSGTGTVITVTVNNGGKEYVFASGTVSNSTVNTGGNAYVNAGGTARSTTLKGGHQFVLGGTAISTTISSGGIETVSSGVTSFTTVSNGGTEWLDGTALSISATVNIGGVEDVYATATTSFTVLSGGTEFVSSGGTAINTIVRNLGEMQISDGGKAISTTVSSGGFEYVYSGTASFTTVSNGGGEYVLGGTTLSTTVDGGGTQYVYSGIASRTTLNGGYEDVATAGTAIGTTVNGGGQDFVYAGGTTSLTTLNSGNELISGGTAVSTTVGNGGQEFVYSGGTTTGTVVNAGGFEYVSAYGTASRTVVSAGGTVHVFSGGTAYGITVLTGGNLIVDPGANSFPCYAAGTRIATARGEAAVEQLRAGDLVRTRSGTLRPVKWLGHRALDTSRHPRPWDVHPVRVRAGAFADGQPHRDLLLSPDHAVFVEDVLIPIRYLINGATVVQEPAAQVTYWHVELDSHDVILAEGLACETYLDTGNRGAFANAGAPLHAHPDFALKIWDAAACAKLAVDGPDFARAQAGLCARLAPLGYTVTAEPALRFITGQDEVLVSQAFDEWICLALPDGCKTLRILSRHFAPAELDPASIDRRRLGVALTHLRLDDTAIALDHARLLSGWHDGEAELRWSNGEGVLDVSGAGVVELRFAQLPARYVVPPAAQPRHARAA